jgi:hypothetical protein
VPAAGGWEAARPLDLRPLAVHRQPVRNAVQGLLAVALGGLAGWLVHAARTAAAAGGVFAPLGRFVRRHALFLGLFAAYAGYYAAWAAAVWPGFVMSDSFGPIAAIRDGRLDAWFSFAYSALILALMQFGDAYPNLVVFQVAATAALAAGTVTFLARTRCPVWLAAVPGAFFLSPTVACYAAFYQRGVLSGLVTAAGLLLLFRVAARCHYGPPGRGGLAAVCGLFLAAVLLRLDNLPHAVVAGGVVLAFAAGHRRRAAACLGLTAAAGGLLAGPVASRVAEAPPGQARDYHLLPLYNPVGALVVRGYYTPTPGEDARVIERVFPGDLLRRHWHPCNDVAYWQAVAAGGFTDADVRALRGVLLRAAVRNPGVVAGARVETFATTLGGPGAMTLPPAPDPARTDGLARPMRDYGLWPAGAADPAAARLRRLAADQTHPKRSVGWLWNTLPQLAVVAAAVLLSRWFPVSAAVGLVLAVRLGVVFLTAPCCYFHYVYDLHLFGPVLLALLGVEWRMRRSAAAAMC